MANQYITTVDPYMSQNDLSGYAPIMADDSKQRALQAAALAQQLQQVNEAGQQHGNGMAGLSPLAMAAMLRKKKPDYDQWQTTGDNTYFGANSNGQGAGLDADMLSTLGLK